MINFILGLVIGIIIGVGMVYFLFSRKSAKETRSKESAQEIKDSNPAVEERKANIEKLEKFIAEKTASDKITNDEVQTFLKVSDATAERYLQELEKNGLIKQVGNIGKDVFYLKS